MRERLPNNLAATPHPGTRLLADGVLLALLLILALRLTLTESLEPMSAALAAALHVAPTADTGPGPASTVALATITLLLATGAALLGRLSRAAWIELAFLAAVLALAGASTLQAANRFAALVGWCDLATALLAAWALARLCTTTARKQIVCCVLIALLAAWTAKGLYQRTVEIPDALRMYYEDKAKIAATNPQAVESPLVHVAEGRLNSRLVIGFIGFSNNLAAGLLPLLFLAGALGALVWQHRRAEDPTAKRQRPDDIPLPILLAALLGAFFVAGTVVLFLTQSKGAIAVFCLALPILAAGLAWPAFFAQHRRALAFGVLAGLALLAAATVAYGLTHHGLPSKSLLFRWHYWVASVPIVESHPALGVGLNNFGNYYSQYKLAVSPEDVKDPHNFLIRAAAELGLPAAALLLALIGLLFYRALREPAAPPDPAPASRAPPFLLRMLILGAVFCCLWWLVRFLWVDASPDPAALQFNAILNALYLACAWAGFALAAAALHLLPPAALRTLGFAALLGAAGMLLYDQVNMALVTGPVAMLFWMLLASAQPPEAAAETARPTRLILAAVLLAGSLALLTQVLVPLARNNFAWDPRPYEQRAAEFRRQGDYTAALRELDAAWTRNPRSQRVLYARLFLEPTPARQADVARLLELNGTDFRLRIRLATQLPDLPPAQRRELLHQALWLNAQLPADEIQRLSAAERQAAEVALQRLE